GGLSVCDRHSRNGTFLNDTPVTDAPLAVHVRDRIRVGNSIFEVLMVSGGPGAGADR
ncbi:MAG: FHA domain-containing protein, partial [Gammaproteobacteria bacterium]